VNSLAGKRVLVVDDEPLNLKVATRMLKKLSMVAIPAETGRTAIDLAISEHFDVVLLDVQMPELDGFDTAKLMRENNITAPIIAYTAHALGSDIERCLDAGMNEHIAKPVLLEDLEATIRKVLNNVK